MLWTTAMQSEFRCTEFLCWREGGCHRYFTHPFYCMRMLLHPTEHKPERILNLLPQIHISKLSMVIYWFHVPNIILTVFIVHIYLFLSRWVWLWNNILLSLKFPPVSVVFCCSTDGKHREAKECFIKLFIVDNCTISLIIRSIVDISAVYSEMAFIILCALKRDFGIFIKENSGVLMPFTP